MNEPNSNQRGSPATERRPNQRRRTLLSAVACHSNGAYTFDCTVRNLSESGARVLIASDVPFPSEIYIIVLRDSVAYEAIVVWNSGREIGVRFRQRHCLSDDVAPGLLFLKRLFLAKLPH